MEEKFWKDAWTDRKIGFHLSEYNKFLEWFMSEKTIASQTTALVPLCGKSLDMIYLRDKGLNVIGVEIAQQAVEEFFKDNDIEHTVNESENFKRYESKGITILCGDIFKLETKDIGDISFIYDRAATVALPPEMRADYYKKLKELTNSNTQMCLLTMHSKNEDKIGPPFSVPMEEIEKAYKSESSHFEVLKEETGKINSKRLRDLGVTERTMVAHHIKFQ
jgi:thiopurine S-methyltransferase